MDRAQRIRALGAGVLLFAAALSAEMAWLHMRALSALGAICGTPPAAHCAWCPMALISGAAGLVLLGLWFQGRPRPQPAMTRTRS